MIPELDTQSVWVLALSVLTVSLKILLVRQRKKLRRLALGGQKNKPGTLVDQHDRRTRKGSRR